MKTTYLPNSLVIQHELPTVGRRQNNIRGSQAFTRVDDLSTKNIAIYGRLELPYVHRRENRENSRFLLTRFDSQEADADFSKTGCTCILVPYYYFALPSGRRKMVDYSKWKDIEISDDEDETHPNVDTPSLFRWRHQARVERMEQFEQEKKILQKKKSDHLVKIKEAREKLDKAQQEGIDLSDLKKQLEMLEKEKAKINDEELEFNKKEKLMPWNVDTISQPGFSKTVVNVGPTRKKEELSEEEREARTKEFFKKHEKSLKHYGMLQKYDDSKRFLQENPELVCEETANYLVIQCINYEMEEKHELMAHVAHQCICMQFMLELAKQLDVDPRACIGSFFTRIQKADVEYRKGFEDELQAFKERIRRRAKEKLDAAIAEAEEEERQKRLGPGGLDPVEVFESLPEVLKECFEKQDIAMLQQVIGTLPEDDARYHMKRCVDSGLWVPDAATADQ